jgi:hypothetical protein
MAQRLDSSFPGRFAPHLKALLLCTALALPGFFAARHLATWPARLRYPGELNSVEGRELAEMTRLREGEPVYAPASPGRFDSTNYGPLFYLLGSRLVDPRQPAYRPLRVLAMLATVALAAACGRLAWWIAGSPAAAALASLMFLAYEFVTTFGLCARPDSLALLLGFSGFLAAYRWQGSSKILWSIPCMVLGAYYKQQFMVAPLAVGLFLVLEKRWREALQFAVLLAASGLGLLAAFEFLIFPRQAFLLHFLTYNRIPFSGWEGLLWLRQLAIILLIPCLMALRSLHLRPDKLLACYLGWAIFLLPIMIAKKGTQMNYCFELILVLCPLVASLVTMRLSSPIRATPLIYLLGVALALGQLSRGGNGDPSPRDFAQDRELQTFLRGNFPPQTPALGFFTGDLLRAGLATPITDLYQYSWLASQGKVPDEWLVGQLRQRRFGVILLASDMTSESSAHAPYGLWVSESFHQAFLQNYRLARTFEFHLWEQRHYYAWVPRR